MLLQELQLTLEWQNSPSFLIEIESAVSKLCELGAIERAVGLTIATCSNIGTQIKKIRPDLKPPILNPDQQNLLQYSRTVTDWLLANGVRASQLYAWLNETKAWEKLRERVDPTPAEVGEAVKNS